jgi:hypothetical protein
VAPDWRWTLDLESGCGKRQRVTDLTLTLLALTGGRAHSALAVRAGSARCCAALAAVYLSHDLSMQSSAFGAVALERLHVEVVRQLRIQDPAIP